MPGDTTAGTLRATVALAQSNDFVTLDACTNSTITLHNGAIPVSVDDLLILGGNAATGRTTIENDGVTKDRVFDHVPPSGFGHGKLTIKYINVRGGTTAGASGYLNGGCIASKGSISLLNATVGGCSASVSGKGRAQGGGVFAYADVSLTDSLVDGNAATALDSQGIAAGGGVFAWDCLTANRSVINNNQVSGTFRSTGGGAYISNQTGCSSSVQNSTISNNKSIGPQVETSAGGLWFRGNMTIANSTISGNTTTQDGGGLWAYLSSSAKLQIYNSTIAFNHADFVEGGLVVIDGVLDLESSILANNTNSGTSVDLSNNNSTATTTITGASNIIMSSAPPVSAILAKPLGTDPKLGPLQNNGGPTLTHALLSGSPAITVGNNKTGSTTDQRGPGYPRSTSDGKSDVGAFEFDAIFWNGFQ